MANTKKVHGSTGMTDTVGTLSSRPARLTPAGRCHREKKNGYVIRPRRTGQKDTADVINNKETDLHPRRVVAEKGVCADYI